MISSLTSNQVKKRAKLNNLEIKIMQYVSTNVNTELSNKEEIWATLQSYVYMYSDQGRPPAGTMMRASRQNTRFPESRMDLLCPVSMMVA